MQFQSSRLKQKHRRRYIALGIGLFSIVTMSLNADDSDTITSEVQTNYPAATEADAQAIELSTRLNVEQTHLDTINRSLYLQGLDDDPAVSVVTEHFQKYCSNSSVLEKANFTCPQDSLIQHGDLKLSGLLSGSRLNAAQQPMILQFLNNLVDPFPEGTLKSTVSVANLTDPSKRQDIAKGLSQQAVLSVIRHPFIEMYAKRLPVPVSGATLTTTGDLSMIQAMEQESVQRFMNQQWQNSVSQETDQLVLLRESVKIQAFQAWMQYQHYKQMERVEALLAVNALQSYRQGSTMDSQMAATKSAQQASMSPLSTTATSSDPNAQ